MLLFQGTPKRSLFLSSSLDCFFNCTQTLKVPITKFPSPHQPYHPGLQKKMWPGGRGKWFYSSLVRSYLEHHIQLQGPKHRKCTVLLEQVQRRATKMVRGLEHLLCEDSLREFAFFSLKKNFTMRAVRHCNRIPREVADASSLEDRQNRASSNHI